MALRRKDIVTAMLCITIVLAWTGEVLKLYGVPLYLHSLAVACVTYLLFGTRGTTGIRASILLYLAAWWSVWGLVRLLGSDLTVTIQPYISVFINLVLMTAIVATVSDTGVALLYSRAAILGHLLTVAVSLYELRTGNHLIGLSGRYVRIFENNAFGFHPNINDNATALFMGGVAVLLAYALRRRHGVIHGVILVLTGYLVWRIGSRAGYASTALFSAVAAYVYVSDRYLGSKYIKRVANYVFIGLTGCVAITMLYTMPLLELVEALFGGGAVYSDLRRLEILRDTSWYAYESALLGLGPGMATARIGTNPHFVFAEILADYGILTFVLLLACLYDLAKVTHTSADSLTKATIVAFVFGFVTVSVASSSMIRVRGAWVILAILYGVRRCYGVHSLPETSQG